MNTVEHPEDSTTNGNTSRRSSKRQRLRRNHTPPPEADDTDQRLKREVVRRANLTSIRDATFIHICCVCNQEMLGNSDSINAHVDRCLIEQNNEEQTEFQDDESEEKASSTFDEYEWAGQTRIRAASLMEGGYRAAGFQITDLSAQKDTEESLDIDGDENPYGKAMFTEEDVRKVCENQRTSDRETVHSEPKCLICMDPYKDPLTSILCWHVHCSDCWFRTLGHKKLCPQCNGITCPSDLRRIYL